MSFTHHPTSRYKMRKLYAENCFLFRAKVLTKLSLWPWLLTSKSIVTCIFFSPSCFYVWSMKAVCWKLCKLSCQNLRIDKVLFVSLNFNPLPQLYMYLPLTILHLYWKLAVSCQLKVLTKFSLWPWIRGIDLLTPKCIGIFLWPPFIYVLLYGKLYVENYSNLSNDQVRKGPAEGLSQWQLLFVMTLNSDPLTSKNIGIFLSISCIYVWNLYYRVRTKVLTYRPRFL